MKSFTKRPVTAWTVSNTTYRIGTSSTGVINNRTQGSSTAIPSSTAPGATTAGLTALNESVGSTRITHLTESGRTQSTIRTNSDQTVRNIAESAHLPNSAINSSDTYSYIESRVFYRSITAGYSSGSSYSGTIATTGSSSTAKDTHSSTTTATSATSTSTSITASTYTGSGTTTTYTTETETLDSTVTTSATDGTTNIFTTWSSSSTYSTTVNTTTGSVSTSSTTWGTSYTALTDQSTTTTAISGSLTWTADDTTNLTATSYGRTSWAFETMLRDTVCLMNANVGSDYNLGGLLWAFKTGVITAGQTTAAAFTDLYASTSSDTITVSERSVFLSSSAPITVITTSTATATTTATRTSTTDTNQPLETYTATYTATSYNGSSYETSDFTVSYSASWSLGDVSSAISTGTITTTTDTNQPAATTSSTIFTHSIQSTGYSGGSIWTSTTTSATWGEDTSGSSIRTAPWSSTATTVTKSSRFSTTDALLISSFSSWSTGAATSDTVSSFLGFVSTSTTRAYSSTATFTEPTWKADLHVSVPSQTSSFIVAGDSRHETTNGGATLTAWTEARAAMHVDHRPEHDNMPDHDQAWFECQPRGYCGFGGSFTVSTLDGYLTTTQGIAAGSTFTEETLSLTATASACDGLTFFPVRSNLRIGGTARAVSTSLLDTPSVMTTAISVAATWSSTTSTTQSSTTATTSTSTTRAATHTLAVASSITGTFISSDAITYNSTARTEIGSGIVGGYMVGDNNRGTSWRAFVRNGCVRWTEYSSGQSTSPITSSITGTDASISFSLPYSKAAVITAEPILTAQWKTAAQSSIASSFLHQKHT